LVKLLRTGIVGAPLVLKRGALPKWPAQVRDSAKQLVLDTPRPDSFDELSAASDGSSLSSPLKVDPKAQRVRVETRLAKTLRHIAKEAEGRGSDGALSLLTNEAIRQVVEAEAWKRLSEFPLDAQPPAVVELLATSTDAFRHVALGHWAWDNAARGPAAEVPASTPLAPLTKLESETLYEMLSSSDPQYGQAVREGLQHGTPIADLRHLLLSRREPVSLEGKKDVDVQASADAFEGLTFDLGINRWVSRDFDWAYKLSLGQLLTYDIKGVINGKAELERRMVASAQAVSGKPLATTDEIQAFVTQLSNAWGAGDAQVEALLAHSFDFYFSTTNGGDKPVGTTWEVPLGTMADLFAAMKDPAFRARIDEVAARKANADAERREHLRAPIAALLEQFPGEPRLHRRAHAALINMGKAGQTVHSLGEPGGVLPRSEFVLDAAAFKAKFANASNLKLRYLLNEDYELTVISDDEFQAVVKAHGFPPNHELLSYGGTIGGSGYLTVDHGTIVALEDDVEMLPGKLPDGLPPAKDVFRLRGFTLDAEAINHASRVLDFEGYLSKAQEPQLAHGALASTLADGRALVEQASHAKRPSLVAQLLGEQLEAHRQAGVNDAAARARTAEFAAQLLEGYTLINVSTKHFRRGDLPPDLNDFSDLTLNLKLADYLVRKLP
jgi:hypothetical protein